MAKMNWEDNSLNSKYKPITDKQIAYLLSLYSKSGIQLKRNDLVDLSMQDAQRLIQELKQ